MLPKGVQANETGHPSMLARVKAARKLLGLIESEAEGSDDLRKRLGAKSAGFITEMREMFEDYDDFDLEKMEKPTPKQYFWIKDCYDKLMEVD